ncbi:uncharacterized protein LOC112456045, partial [Temnothorax curvispinosus]|uniref:Uncharacterized protein LOC112456045 n=1 Tax=Temnothorax curvispinosus TaxID=300111 RepID=A0A6J1PZC6_9HYME
MTSFGATKIICDNYMPTFKVQGQIYHRAGSLLPMPDADYKFLQIYFMGTSDEQVHQRCRFNSGTNPEIVVALQNLFDQYNELVRMFRTALQRMPADDYVVVIRADKTPPGQHERQYNAPTINEVAIVVVGEEFNSRDIILHRRDDEETNKKVSAMNYYSYRLMIRENADNHILKCRQLFHQYIVDMYAKIETERLLFIRLNQTKLRSEQYIHLRDAIAIDSNPNELGKIVILPSTFTGSPRHMHEYAQDAMTYVRAYGRPDLFITITCNRTWDEIKELLLPGQSSADRHDIIARVFKQKLKSMMDFIVKHHVFGETRCWMYSIEWQKRGLPHAHILIWLLDKIIPDKIDEVILAEIPDVQNDPGLFEVVTKNNIHGPCGAINNNSPCMKDRKCTKRYPRDLHSETITGNDGYPQYHRRSTKDGGKLITIKVRNNNIEVDNRWVVPYSPLLSETFKAHINVKYCNSVKSIKYICKYVNKGSDMAVFGVENAFAWHQSMKSNDINWDATLVAMKLFGVFSHFQFMNVIQQLFIWQYILKMDSTYDLFARTLLYSEVPKYYTWNASAKKFQRRKQGKPVEGYSNLYLSNALGRLYTVHLNNQECFYLRLLLVNVRGPKSFQELKTVNGELCTTYREACQKLNLLENDAHWDTTLDDASNTAQPQQI